MKRFPLLQALVFAASLLGSEFATAQPVPVWSNPNLGEIGSPIGQPQQIVADSEYYYQVFSAYRLSWSDAAAAARDWYIEIDGERVYGQLVTIETAQEFEAIESLREATVPLLGNRAPGVWVGGLETAFGWQWIDGGVIPDVDNCTDPDPLADCIGLNPGDPFAGLFALWVGGVPQPEKPNKNELNFLSIWYQGDDPDKYEEGFYNTTLRSNSVGGFVVVYSGESVTSCRLAPGQSPDEEGAGCKYSPRLTKFALPSSSTALDGNIETRITFTEKVILDPRVDPDTLECDGTILYLESGDLELSGHGCGTPYIKIIKGSAENVTIPSGTVWFDAETDDDSGTENLPQNDSRVRCDINDSLAVEDRDIRLRHRVGYQSTRLRADGSPDMQENKPENAFYGLQDGTIATGPDGIIAQPASAGIFTGSCGSIQFPAREKSYFLIGLRMPCTEPPLPAAEYSWASLADRSLIVECFARFAVLSLDMLLQSLEDAAPVIDQGDSQKMINQALTAKSKLVEGNYTEALKHIRNLIDFANLAAYAEPVTVPGSTAFNTQGEILQRAISIRNSLEMDIIPNEG